MLSYSGCHMVTKSFNKHHSSLTLLYNGEGFLVRGLFSICVHVYNEWLKIKVNELKEMVMEIKTVSQLA